jgi:hypothetical protein
MPIQHCTSLLLYADSNSAKADLQGGGISEGPVFLRRQRLPRDWRSATGKTVTQVTVTHFTVIAAKVAHTAVVCVPCTWPQWLNQL